MESKHIYFSGIGGTGLGPLALVAHQAGYHVSGSDKQDSNYIHYLKDHGIVDTHIGQSTEQIAAVHEARPIDWLVYSSAVMIEHPDAPELEFCRKNGIKMSKRDELLASILEQKDLQLIAIAGTHGKTTTTAMAIWLFSQLGIPVSHSVGGKMLFADMGHYEPGSTYFIYEADEYDRNFLTFNPPLSIITGVDWDHADIYPTREDYQAAFRQFLGQSERAIVWRDDAETLNVESSETLTILDKQDSNIDQQLSLPGTVNRQDAWQVAHAAAQLVDRPFGELVAILNEFPGVTRRFERIIPGLYSDYAHTPPKIRGTLDTAREVAGDNVVIVYEGLHNTRQHFIRDELTTLFENVKQLYIVPSYLAREDESLALLSPEDLKNGMSEATIAHTVSSQLDPTLEESIQTHIDSGDTVVCISAGGGGSLDEWLRKKFAS